MTFSGYHEQTAPLSLLLKIFKLSDLMQFQTLKLMRSTSVNDYPQYQPPPPFLLEGQCSVPNFERGGIRKHTSVWGI